MYLHACEDTIDGDFYQPAMIRTHTPYSQMAHLTACKWRERWAFATWLQFKIDTIYSLGSVEGKIGQAVIQRREDRRFQWPNLTIEQTSKNAGRVS